MALTVAVMTSGALLAVLAVGTALDRWRLAPVLSGSMDPEVAEGSLVLAEPVPVEDLGAGDILLFHAPTEERPLVVHRIYDVAARDRSPVFRTKGDANERPDPWTIRIKGARAWRVRHVAPVLGGVVGILADAGARMLVLVLGVGMLTLWGLRALWALRPISWRADDPYGDEQRRRARRASARVALLGTVGVLIVGMLGAMGLAYAQFSATAPPPMPGFASGSLPTPTGPTCRWASTTSVDLGWTAVAPDFATAYDVGRSDTDGGPYSSIGTTPILSPPTFTDPSAGPPTLRYYVVTTERSTWESPASTQLVSNACGGAIRLVAGTSNGFGGDGGPATSARLSAPRGVAVDAAGNVFIADTANNRIRRVDAATGVITTVAGGGSNPACTYSGAATTVSLSGPRGVAVDASGTLFIADTGRNCIRRVASGTVTHVAGGGATTACTYTGAAAAVSLSAPSGVAVDTAGDVYVADTGRSCIRRVASGTVSQVAGGGGATACTYTGAAAAVSLSAPAGVAVDTSGRVVVSDSGRRCVRLVAGGSVTQVAGTGASGSAGDNGPAIGALLTSPAAVATDTGGNVWIADAGAHRVRRVVGPL